jgi:BioD-like phosphotransacetylase family protein
MSRCKKIFVAATDQNCGKTTTSLSLLYLAQQKYNRVGFMKPFGPKRTTYQGHATDVDAALVAYIFELSDDLEQMSPVVLDTHTTRDFLDGKIDSEFCLKRIKQAARELEEQCDFLIIEGAGHAGVGSVMGLSNARLAKELDAPVMIVSEGGVGWVIDALHLNLTMFRQSGADVRMVFVNKLIQEKRDATMRYLKLAFKDDSVKIVGGFNYTPVLANPTLKYLSEFLDLPLRGDAGQGSRIIHNVRLGAASSQRVVDLLDNSSLVIVTSSRNEVLVMLSTLYHLPEYQEKIAGLLISGVVPITAIVQRVLDDSGIPYMRSQETTANLYTRIQGDVAKIGLDDLEKISLVRQLAETELCFETIDALF